MPDNKPTDRPKKTPGPQADPRRGHPRTSDTTQPPAHQPRRTGPPEGYAEEQPGKNAHEQPSNKDTARPDGVEPKATPGGANKDDRAQRKAAAGGKPRRPRGET